MGENHGTGEATILVLDDETINKIAAGEVIERPASVVKELVENSLDAGASAVTVEVGSEPGDFIRVSDDGSGMSRRDARTAFLRHATSKIRGPEDLRSILTMGFRGEALASIAAVSRVELVTRRTADVVGTRIVYEGGRLVLEEDAPSPVGTSVTCRDLFFNTPARRKFQKRQETEFDHIRDAAARLALAWPTVRLRLIHGGREVLLVQGGKARDKRQAIAEVYGSGLAKALVPVVAGTARTKIDGFISPPDVVRSNRDAQCIIVNRRPCVAPAVVRAIENAYGRRLPSGRYPALFLWILTDPMSCDVNVHPAKREIRFSVGHEVFQLAAQAAAAALRSMSAAPDLGRSLGHGPAERRATEETAPEDGCKYRFTPDSHATSPSASETLTAQAVHEAASERSRASCRFTPLGGFMGTYVLAADGTDLVIIDQHAAHERILYEAVVKGLSSGKPDVQSIIPTPLDLSARAASRATAVADDLARIGFVLEPFGQSSFLLRGVPAALGSSRMVGDVVEAVKDSLEACLDGDDVDQGRDAAHLLARVAAEISCHAAVKAHSPLEPAEIERLLADLSQTDDPYSCPHGRPVLIRIGRDELDRAFRRI